MSPSETKNGSKISQCAGRRTITCCIGRHSATRAELDVHCRLRSPSTQNNILGQPLVPPRNVEGVRMTSSERTLFLRHIPCAAHRGVAAVAPRNRGRHIHPQLQRDFAVRPSSTSSRARGQRGTSPGQSELGSGSINSTEGFPPLAAPFSMYSISTLSQSRSPIAFATNAAASPS